MPGEPSGADSVQSGAVTRLPEPAVRLVPSGDGAVVACTGRGDVFAVKHPGDTPRRIRRGIDPLCVGGSDRGWVVAEGAEIQRVAWDGTSLDAPVRLGGPIAAVASDPATPIRLARCGDQVLCTVAGWNEARAAEGPAGDISSLSVSPSGQHGVATCPDGVWWWCMPSSAGGEVRWIPHATPSSPAWVGAEQFAQDLSGDALMWLDGSGPVYALLDDDDPVPMGLVAGVGSALSAVGPGRGFVLAHGTSVSWVEPAQERWYRFELPKPITALARSARDAAPWFAFDDGTVAKLELSAIARLSVAT